MKNISKWQIFGWAFAATIGAGFVGWLIYALINNPSQLFQAVVAGVLRGSVYALVALGWVLIYKCSGVLNLAMGELTLVGGYVCLQFHIVFSQIGIAPPFLSFLLAMGATLVVGLMLGILTERAFLDRMIGEPVLAVIMVTVGLAFFFNGIVQLIWGTHTIQYAPQVFSTTSAVNILGLLIEPVYLAAFPVAILMLGIFMLFFQRTRWGLSMQATADDEMAALSLGVSARFVYAAAWSIAFMAAGVAGTMLGNVTAGMNISVSYYGLLVLPAVVLGGLNSVPGAVVGGVLIGIMEMLCDTYLAQVTIGGKVVFAGVNEWGPLVFMAVFLLYKPYGFWGWERIERV